MAVRTGCRDLNSGAEYAACVDHAHAATSQVHTHNITTHSCDIDGDVAHCDSYVIVVLLGKDGRTTQSISGGYLDRLERRNGRWRIALRRSTVEVMFTADTSVMRSSFLVPHRPGLPTGPPRPSPAIVGDKASVRTQLQSLLDAGATDIWAAIVPIGPDPATSARRTRDLLREPTTPPVRS
ncbi:nuclear transport factor 2 family protein [Spirillospora sp. CA-255316]